VNRETTDMTEESKKTIRQRKLEYLRMRIENGSYRIEASDLAEAILRSMQAEPVVEDEGQAA
jgi:anti-sigma28 factor (negative regulator of flagellin synthesis)